MLTNSPMLIRLTFATLLIFIFTPSAHADDTPPAPPKVNVETIFTGLDHPCAVTKQPKTGDLFVSNTSAGQVVSFAANKPGAPTVVIAGFAHDNGGQTSLPWK